MYIDMDIYIGITIVVTNLSHFHGIIQYALKTGIQQHWHSNNVREETALGGGGGAGKRGAGIILGHIINFDRYIV